MSATSLDDETEEESVDLNSMTKAELQEYADSLGIAEVNSSKQTKSEMIETIEAALGEG